MADKNIGSLPSAPQIDDASLLIMEQQGEAMKLTGKQIADFARESASANVQEAVKAAAEAGRSAQAAAELAAGVEESAATAQTARQGAEAARAAIENMLVEAVTLATGTPASVSKELVDGVVKLVFGLPAGPKGDKGASIRSIDRTDGTGAAGTVDTYTVTMTDGSASTFRVYNGADGEGAGDMLKATYDPQNKNTDVFQYAEGLASGKQDKLTGQAGQVVGFDADGNATAQPAPESGVISFHGRSGAVVPQAGDYTAAQVGLGSVDNTADADKPVSAAQKTAIDAALAAAKAYTDTSIQSAIQSSWEASY